jgi:hypothetical protein
MRGSRTIFKDVFENRPTPVEKRKGRSPMFHQQRNEVLVARFYYYGKFTEKRYEGILDSLSFEFHLSPVTIPELISDNMEQLASLKAKQPPKSYFSKKWPYLVW